MADEEPRKIATFLPRPRDLIARIRSAAADSRNVAFGRHALQRMEERDITTLDALRVLRAGEIRGDIEPGAGASEWKCKVTAKKKGSREIGVITVVLQSGRLFIKTVEWEDR